MNKKELKIFDMDRTLIDTPEFINFIDVQDGEFIDTKKYFPDHFKSIKTLFWDTLMKEVGFIKNGTYIVVINTKNKGTFDGMQLSNIQEKKPQASKYLELFDDTIVVKHPAGFYTEPDTLGYVVNNPVFNEYKAAENKMILTGRGEKLRPNILKMLHFLNMEEPNQGLMLWPGSPKIIQWKADVILETAATKKWDIIHFYEDKEDWLNHAKVSMEQQYPEIKFMPHHIKTVG